MLKFITRKLLYGLLVLAGVVILVFFLFQGFGDPSRLVMGQTGVTKSIEGGKTYFGTPIEESREKLKQLANVKRIPEIIEKLKQNDK